MKILALDASTEACSAAVYVNGEIVERLTIAPRKHIEILMPMIKEVMAESELEFSDLNGLAFSAGPGSFAGLRIACGFAQGLGSGLDLPIVPVSTLATLALPVLEEHPEAKVMPMMDAKMQEVYWGLYALDEEGELKILEGDQVSSLDALYEQYEGKGEGIIGVGDGWLLDEESAAIIGVDQVADKKHPRAGEVALLAIDDLEKGLGLYADQVSPIYLRHNVALTLEEQAALRAAKN